MDGRRHGYISDKNHQTVIFFQNGSPQTKKKTNRDFTVDLHTKII